MILLDNLKKKILEKLTFKNVAIVVCAIAVVLFIGFAFKKDEIMTQAAFQEKLREQMSVLQDSHQKEIAERDRLMTEYINTINQLNEKYLKAKAELAKRKETNTKVLTNKTLVDLSNEFCAQFELECLNEK